MVSIRRVENALNKRLHQTEKHCNILAYRLDEKNNSLQLVLEIGPKELTTQRVWVDDERCRHPSVVIDNINKKPSGIIAIEVMSFLREYKIIE